MAKRKEKKVLFLTTSFPAFMGHWQSPFVYELARHLAKRHRVFVLAPLTRSFPESKRHEFIDGMHVFRFSFAPLRFQTLNDGAGIPSNLKRSLWAWIQMPLFLFSFWRHARKLAKNYDFDVVHCQWVLSALPALFLGKPVVLTTRGSAMNMLMKFPFGKNILQWILSKCDFVAPNNTHHVETIMKLGISPERVRFVPNGIRDDFFRIGKKKHNGSNILFVGHIIKNKGVECLVRAVSIMDQKAELVIVGDGNDRKEMETLAKNLGVNARFAGSVPPERVPGFMSEADVFVLPSRSEGRPNVVLEAMAARVPVVASDIPGIREIVEDGRTGLLFRPDSCRELSKKISVVLNDRKLAREMVKNAFKAVKNLSWEKAAERFSEIYEKAERSRKKKRIKK